MEHGEGRVGVPASRSFRHRRFSRFRTLDCCIVTAGHMEAKVPFLKSLCLDGLLSFPPGSEAIELKPLNFLIGPNGSGKSNLIEGIELLQATPPGFANAIRDGGGVREWLWKGEDTPGAGWIETLIDLDYATHLHPFGTDTSGMLAAQRTLFQPDIRYRVTFAALGQRVEITDEVIENAEKTNKSAEDGHFYYRFQNGNPVVTAKSSGFYIKGRRTQRSLDRKTLKPDESILAQLKNPSVYPELTEIGRKFERIRSFREWSFGRDAKFVNPNRQTYLPMFFRTI